MLNKITSFFFFSLLIFSNVLAQELSGNVSLKQAIEYSLNENTDIKKQNLEIAKSKYQVQEVHGKAFPQLSGTAQITDNLKIQEQLLPGEIFGQPGTFLPVKFGVQYAIPLSVRWDQLIFNKAYFTSIEQAMSASQLSNLQKEKVTQDIIYNVSTAYYQSILIREQTNIINANLKKLSQSVDVAQVKFDNQMIRKIDLDQLKVNRTNTQADLDNTEVSFAHSLDLLKILMGFPLIDTLILTDTIVDVDYTIPVNSIVQNPSLDLIDQHLKMKRLEIKGINANYFPTLSGFAQYGYQSQFDEFTAEQMKWTSSSVIGASLNIPIFDGMQKKRQVQRVKTDIKSITMDKQLADKNLNSQYTNSVRKFQQSEKTAMNQKVNYELAQSVYEAIQINYQNGLASLSDLINADSGLKGAQTQYLSALLQKRISALDILLANGSMTDLIK